MNGEVVTAFEEGSTMMINGEEVSVTFDESDVLVNGESVSVASPAAAVLNREVAGEVVAGFAGILLSNIYVYEEAVSVVYDGSVAVVNGHPVVATISVNF